MTLVPWEEIEQEIQQILEFTGSIVHTYFTGLVNSLFSFNTSGSSSSSRSRSDLTDNDRNITVYRGLRGIVEDDGEEVEDNNDEEVLGILSSRNGADHHLDRSIYNSSNYMEIC